MDPTSETRPETHYDTCALPFVQRVAALLDRDPASFRNGDPLPRGWHVALFTVPTLQRDLRPNGLGRLAVEITAE